MGKSFGWVRCYQKLGHPGARRIWISPREFGFPPEKSKFWGNSTDFPGYAAGNGTNVLVLLSHSWLAQYDGLVFLQVQQSSNFFLIRYKRNSPGSGVLTVSLGQVNEPADLPLHLSLNESKMI